MKYVCVLLIQASARCCRTGKQSIAWVRRLISRLIRLIPLLMWMRSWCFEGEFVLVSVSALPFLGVFAVLSRFDMLCCFLRLMLRAKVTMQLQPTLNVEGTAVLCLFSAP